jgi:hypothetical protein
VERALVFSARQCRDRVADAGCHLSAGPAEPPHSAKRCGLPAGGGCLGVEREALTERSEGRPPADGGHGCAMLTYPVRSTLQFVHIWRAERAKITE